MEHVINFHCFSGQRRNVVSEWGRIVEVRG